MRRSGRGERGLSRKALQTAYPRTPSIPKDVSHSLCGVRSMRLVVGGLSRPLSHVVRHPEPDRQNDRIGWAEMSTRPHSVGRADP